MARAEIGKALAVHGHRALGTEELGEPVTDCCGDQVLGRILATVKMRRVIAQLVSDRGKNLVEEIARVGHDPLKNRCRVHRLPSL